MWAAAMSWFVEDEDEKRAPGMAAHEQGEGHAMKDEDKGRRERGTGVGGGGGLVQLPAWYAEADAQVAGISYACAVFRVHVLCSVFICCVPYACAVCVCCATCGAELGCVLLREPASGRRASR